MIKDEFQTWMRAGNYSLVEQCDWLINMIVTMESKEKHSQDVRNNLYAIIKQQQAKMQTVTFVQPNVRKPGEFKVGDRVKRINNQNTEEVQVGSIGTVVDIKSALDARVCVTWDHLVPTSHIQGRGNFPYNLELIAPAAASILNDPAVRAQLDILQNEIRRLRDTNKGVLSELHTQRKETEDANKHADEMQRRLLQIHNFCQGY